MSVKTYLSIQSFEIIEETEFCDIEVPLIGNFILANGVVAHNCAHSTSYAIVSYNGAYLKHHYPVYFWLGMLSIVTDDHDSLKSYLSECSHLVLPVDIIHSHPSEWRIEGDKLRPPLSLLKGCGGTSVDRIRDILLLSLDELRIKKYPTEEKEQIDENSINPEND